MAKTIYVDCPFCEGMIEVDVESGAVINKWSSGDRSKPADDKMKSALKKIGEGKKRRENLFDQAREELEGQKKKLEDTFKKQVEKAKKEGLDEKPFRPFDLD